MLDPDPETNADMRIRYKDDFHLSGAFSVQTVAEAELTPDVENSSLEQVSQLPQYCLITEDKLFTPFLVF
jgi:hypothetical protein